MKCPHCAHLESRVVDSRMARDGEVIRRRRQCDGCGERFTTYERAEESVPVVVKKDNRREAFDRAKLLRGIKRACEKRPIPVERLEGLVDDIERTIHEGNDQEIESSRLGELMMERLRLLDEVAYVRFASVYRSFKDVNEFMSELSDLLRQRAGGNDD